MASITRKSNGTYLIRIAAGRDDNGNYQTVSRTFRPSKPTLSYSALQKELNLFVENLESQVANGEIFCTNGQKAGKTNPGKCSFQTSAQSISKSSNTNYPPGHSHFTGRLSPSI